MRRSRDGPRKATMGRARIQLPDHVQGWSILKSYILFWQTCMGLFLTVWIKNAWMWTNLGNMALKVILIFSGWDGPISNSSISPFWRRQRLPRQYVCPQSWGTGGSSGAWTYKWNLMPKYQMSNPQHLTFNVQIAGLAEPQLCEDWVWGGEPLPSPIRLHYWLQWDEEDSRQEG